MVNRSSAGLFAGVFIRLDSSAIPPGHGAPISLCNAVHKASNRPWIRACRRPHFLQGGPGKNKTPDPVPAACLTIDNASGPCSFPLGKPFQSLTFAPTCTVLAAL